MGGFFTLNSKTKIETNKTGSKPIRNAIYIVYRDMEKTLEKQSGNSGENGGKIIVDINDDYSSFLQPEQFCVCSENGVDLLVKAADELGGVYGLLYISERYLGVLPFGFWNGHIPPKSEKVLIPFVEYIPNQPLVRYRGWFINDEVLLNEWQFDGNNENVWRMVFETLLRCRGNMVIAGTGKDDADKRILAFEMGLWITHHHATPLGAEMFFAVYPNEKASYYENGRLFEKLWETAVVEQKEMSVIWSVGFRGQGDKAFWDNDKSVVTMEDRGRLISEVIKKQCEIIRRYVDKPVFCTNLYGEIMELYEGGHLDIPAEVIKVWADSGYGKMVSRRQGNKNKRIHALPADGDGGTNGIYYHASFHDLQASNHMTMSPNPPEFIIDELKKCIKARAGEYWIINCGNVKPHTYILDLIRDMWQNGDIVIDSHLQGYVSDYFEETEFNSDIAAVYKKYFECIIQYGKEQDERAGEQFYNYTARHITNAWIKGQTDKSIDRLAWATGDLGFDGQILWFKEKCLTKLGAWQELTAFCNGIDDRMRGGGNCELSEKFHHNLVLQVKTHFLCCRGSVYLCDSYEYFKQREYAKAFVLACAAKNDFDSANHIHSVASFCEYGGFYDNDCLTNIKLTAYCCDSLRRYIRIFGEGPGFHGWEREYLYDERDKNIVLLTAYKNHLSDDELFLALDKALFELKYFSATNKK